MIRCNETDVAHPIATVRFLYIPHADIKSACFFVCTCQYTDLTNWHYHFNFRNCLQVTKKFKSLCSKKGRKGHTFSPLCLVKKPTTSPIEHQMMRIPRKVSTTPNLGRLSASFTLSPCFTPLLPRYTLTCASPAFTTAIFSVP